MKSIVIYTQTVKDRKLLQELITKVTDSENNELDWGLLSQEDLKGHNV